MNKSFKNIIHAFACIGIYTEAFCIVMITYIHQVMTIIITYYNKNGMMIIGLFGYGIRAKDTARQHFEYDESKVIRFGSWVWCFGKVR